MSFKEQFEVKYVGGFISRIHFWLTVRRLRRKKIELFWEAYMDKVMLETQYGADLNYDDAEDRKLLAQLRQAPGNKADMERVLNIEQKIARSKSVKDIYRKTNEILDEQEQYIKMIDLWNSKNKSQTDDTTDTENSL